MRGTLGGTEIFHSKYGRTALWVRELIIVKKSSLTLKLTQNPKTKNWRYLGDRLCSATGGIMNVGNYHDGGFPITEQIAITTQYDIESRKRLVQEKGSGLQSCN